MSEKIITRRAEALSFLTEDFDLTKYQTLRVASLLNDFLAYRQDEQLRRTAAYSFEEIIKRDQARGEILRKYTPRKDEL